MHKKGFTGASAVALILSLLLTGIILFWLLAVCNLRDSHLFVPALVFALLNMVAIVFISTAGTWLSGKMGVGFYAALCSATILYTLAQFIHLMLSIGSNMTVTGYVLYHLIVCFLYLLIVLPIGIFGAGRKKNQ